MSNFIIIRQKYRPFVRGDHRDVEGRGIHKRLQKKFLAANRAEISYENR